MLISLPRSVIVLVVDLLGVTTDEAEGQAPFTADLDRPNSFASGLELVQIKAGQCHVRRILGLVKVG